MTPFRRAWPVLLLLLASCGKPNPADQPKAPEAILDFSTLFARNCVACHGREGKLGPAPPLNDPLFLAIVPEEVLREVITRGRSGTLMPAFSRQHSGDLTDKQVEALATGLRKEWGRPIDRQPPPPPYLLPKTAAGSTSADRKRGGEVFEMACSMCHGKEGKGGEGADAGPINDEAFLALISNQALRRIIITGRPDLGMPPYDGTDGRGPDFKPLTAAQVDDLVALLASWRKAPAP
jgi:mono/diheme cytochrome c family protein